MTSPPSLPLVENGMIWDGVAEYSNVSPLDTGGSVYMLRIYRDGTRRISGIASSAFPMQDLLRLSEQEGWESIGLSFDLGIDFRLPVDGSAYLGYDGFVVLEPVNQQGYLVPYREHAARFAHQLDAAMGHHSLQSAEEEDRLTTFQTLSDMIGSAEIRYDAWAAVDPQELVIGGNNDGLLLWKVLIDEPRGVDELLCGQCDVATFARRFLFNANLPAFRRLYRSGIIYAADRSVTPWEPTLFGVATQPESDYYELLNANYHAALQHYDEVVGAAEHI